MGYGDITWCKGDGCKHFNTCGRALTDTIREKARRWWGNDNYLIACYENPKLLSCYEANTTETSLKEETGTG